MKARKSASVTILRHTLSQWRGFLPSNCGSKYLNRIKSMRGGVEVDPYPQLLLGGNLFGYALSAVESKALLVHAFDQGNLGIDTASVYGNGTSEEHIGGFLATGVDRSSIFISTKVGVGRLEESAGLGTRKQIRRSLDSSLRRLRTDYVDLLSLHHPDVGTPLEDTLAAASELKSLGLIRDFGISNPIADTFRLAAGQSVGAFHVYGNLVDDDLIGEANNLKASCAKLLVYGVLARSVLISGVSRERHEKSRAALNSQILDEKSRSDVARFTKSLSEYAATHGMSSAQVLMHYVRCLGAIPVLGCRTQLQFDDFFGAVMQATPSGFCSNLQSWRRENLPLTPGWNLGRPRRIDSIGFSPSAPS